MITKSASSEPAFDNSESYVANEYNHNLQGYNILVPFTGDAAGISTVQSLINDAAHPERLWVVGTSSHIAALSGRVPGALRCTRLPRAPSWADVLSVALREGGDRDLLVVCPGVHAVPVFDARLAWSVAGQEGVVAVSPLCDADPLTTLRRFGSLPEDPVELDDRLSRAAGRKLIDAPYVIPECVYLRMPPLLDLIEHTGEVPDSFVSLVTWLRQRGLLVALAPHVYLTVNETARRTEPVIDSREFAVFLADSEVHAIAEEFFRTESIGARRMVRNRSRPRILHITHSLGGGLERWVRIFASADDRTDSLILKSIGERGLFGSQLWLYDSPDARRPIQTWKLARPIPDSVVGHLGYRDALEEILQSLGIDGIVVSSLIGHSLDCLQLDRPTVVLAHDYYPFCPALHIYFKGVCERCTRVDLAECLMENRLVDVFDDKDPGKWWAVRQAFIRSAREGRFHLVAPSPSVVRHYRQLVSDFAEIPFSVISHGGGAEDIQPLPVGRSESGRLRVLVLGRLNSIKGAELVSELTIACSDIADFHLVGCGEAWGHQTRGNIHPIPHYQRPDLPSILQRIQPDLAILPSIVPETFSFTLSECLTAGVPPVASRCGSFVDRIIEGENGFLASANLRSFEGKLRYLDANRGLLTAAQQSLQCCDQRTALDMTSEYYDLMKLPILSAKAYFSTMALPEQRSGMDLQLPPSSPLGLLDYLRQVEEGACHHLARTTRLAVWQRRAAVGVTRAFFGTLRRVARLF